MRARNRLDPPAGSPSAEARPRARPAWRAAARQSRPPAPLRIPPCPAPGVACRPARQSRRSRRRRPRCSCRRPRRLRAAPVRPRRWCSLWRRGQCLPRRRPHRCRARTPRQTRPSCSRCTPTPCPLPRRPLLRRCRLRPRRPRRLHRRQHPPHLRAATAAGPPLRRRRPGPALTSGWWRTPQSPAHLGLISNARAPVSCSPSHAPLLAAPPHARSHSHARRQRMWPPPAPMRAAPPPCGKRSRSCGRAPVPCTPPAHQTRPHPPPPSVPAPRPCS